MLIDMADLGLDEAATINETNGNVFSFYTNALGYSVFEPVYKIIFLVWVKLTAYSVYGMRALSALAVSMGAGFLFKKLLKYSNFRVACWCSLFFFINNVFLFYSQNIGNVSIAILLAILSVFVFIELYQNPTIKKAIQLAGINVILFYICNACVCIALIQFALSFFLLKQHIKLAIISFLLFLIGTNYPLVHYFLENNILAKQLNLGMRFENIQKLLYLNFVDYFFFNLAVLLTLTIVLNIYIKKLNIRIHAGARPVLYFFYAAFVLTFIFVVKTEAFLHYNFEITALSFFSLSMVVLLGFLFGQQRFSPKINLLAFIFILAIFLPSMQLGASKHWPSKYVVNLIKSKQGVKTVFLYNNFSPFLFYLSPEDFSNSNFKNIEIKYKNLQRMQDVKTVLYKDTIIFILSKNIKKESLDPLMLQSGFNAVRETRGNYEIIQWCKRK